jgi:hypothetical protein
MNRIFVLIYFRTSFYLKGKKKPAADQLQVFFILKEF